MRILLTGGTGMIGRRLAARLRGRGDEVTIVSRSADETRRDPGYRSIRVVPGDVLRAGAWQDEVDGVDAVVNLAGQNLFARRWSDAVRVQIRDSRVYATDNLVGAVQAARHRPGVFVQGSAIGFYGWHGDEVLTEAAGSGTDFLAVVCRELEEAAAPVADLGVRLVSVRTGVVLGRKQGALGVMVPIFRWGGGSPIGSGASALKPAQGRQWLSWIHVDDIVGLFLLAIDQPAAVGPLNGTAPQPVRNAEFSRALAQVLRRPMLPFGPPDLLLGLLLGGVAQAVTKGQRVVPERAQQLGYRFEHPDLAEALRFELRRSKPAIPTLPHRVEIGPT